MAHMLDSMNQAHTLMELGKVWNGNAHSTNSLDAEAKRLLIEMKDKRKKELGSAPTEK